MEKRYNVQKESSKYSQLCQLTSQNYRKTVSGKNIAENLVRRSLTHQLEELSHNELPFGVSAPVEPFVAVLITAVDDAAEVVALEAALFVTTFQHDRVIVFRFALPVVGLLPHGCCHVHENGVAIERLAERLRVQWHMESPHKHDCV